MTLLWLRCVGYAASSKTESRVQEGKSVAKAALMGQQPDA
jgi:hypothetical protein